MYTNLDVMMEASMIYKDWGNGSEEQIKRRSCGYYLRLVIIIRMGATEYKSM